VRLGGGSLTEGMACLEQLGVLGRREGPALWHSCNMYCQGFLVRGSVLSKERLEAEHTWSIQQVLQAACAYLRMRTTKNIKLTASASSESSISAEEH